MGTLITRQEVPARSECAETRPVCPSQLMWRMEAFREYATVRVSKLQLRMERMNLEMRQMQSVTHSP
jgi:hypothetical protein